MALDYCTECQTIEGKWREPTAAECAEYGWTEDDISESECAVCCECGGVGTWQGVAEHDDYDMER